jgi:oxygen-independent coproporphyrinogen III oxidase
MSGHGCLLLNLISIKGLLMRKIIWPSDGLPSHFYIHWPFCASRCSYCDFVALEKHDQFAKRYHNALCKEIEEFSSWIGKEPATAKSLFFGGGTPSLYPLEMMRQFFKVFGKLAKFDDSSEVTIEANPDGVTDEHLRVWKELGINRISFGVQVLDDKVNTSMNRHQRSSEVLKVLDKAFKLFDNISVDLIIGLPGVTNDSWNKTLDSVLSFPIKHMSLYHLTIYHHTKIFHEIRKGTVKLPNADKIMDQYEETRNRLFSSGFSQYEVSNFAKPGNESIHNKAYWDHVPYKGFGISASSFDGTFRFTNEKNLISYMDRIETGKVSTNNAGLFFEELSSEQIKMERLMLGLRQSSGLNEEEIFLLSSEIKENLSAKIDLLETNGLVERNSGQVSLTPQGMIVESGVIESLL